MTPQRYGLPGAGLRMRLVSVRPALPGDAEAVLRLLSQEKGLELAFEAAEFAVAVAGGEVVGCARLRRHADGALEIASVATAPRLRRQGVASRLLGHVLAGVGEPVYALALAPEFFAAHGFRETPREGLPAGVAAKAQGLCASQPFKAMVRPPAA